MYAAAYDITAFSFRPRLSLIDMRHTHVCTHVCVCVWCLCVRGWVWIELDVVDVTFSCRLCCR